jgi:hypothetical protein
MPWPRCRQRSRIPAPESEGPLKSGPLMRVERFLDQ